jgi:catalase
MSSIASALRTAATSAVTTFTETAKIKDLQKDTVECNGDKVLTTDHGVKISDTDNW